ncbi:hypothetical protein WM31_32560 [Burkholderia ubonensis]|nr:hypothetical protein WM31_32560 [Burkholderia ubonensis]
MVRSVLLGLVTEAVLAITVTFAATYVATMGKTLSIIDWWGATVVLSLAALLWKPVTALIFGTRHFAPLAFKADCRAMIVGRVVGTILGLGFGITVAGTLISVL